MQVAVPFDLLIHVWLSLLDMQQMRSLVLIDKPVLQRHDSMLVAHVEFSCSIRG